MSWRILLGDAVAHFLDRRGVHVFKSRFDNPVPDLARLRRDRARHRRPSAMRGVDMNLAGQLELLRTKLARRRGECDFPVGPAKSPWDYSLGPKPSFGLLSAIALHAMVREERPRRVVEIGSGNSTLVAARAARMNAAEGAPVELTAIDPFPSFPLVGMPGLARHLERPVQDVDGEEFARLEAGDILFIDSSHVVATGNDVVHLFLDVLPRLARGVLVQVHDIFFPFDYPEDWILENRWFWNEQYLLQAFLAHNAAWRVEWCESHVKHAAADELERWLPGAARASVNGDSNSLWMRRVA